MARAHKLLALATVLLVLASSAGVALAASGHPGQPTRKQIAAAVRAATRSRLLWATIDSCDPGSHTVGIRGEMPALPFAAHLLMVVSVREFSATAHRYVTLRRTWKLGGDVFDGNTIVQNGLRLRWSGQVTLTASIDFKWFRDGRLIGSAIRRTTAGHAGADTNRYSVATCSIT